jgi:hypothetical protein
MGKLLTLLSKVRLTLKSLPGTNTLAYFTSGSMTKEKKVLFHRHLLGCLTVISLTWIGHDDSFGGGKCFVEQAEPE